jgi:hypothetical protein
MIKKGCQSTVLRNNALAVCGKQASFSGLCDEHLDTIVRQKRSHLEQTRYALKRKPANNNYLREQEKLVKWFTMYREWLLKHPDKALEL